MTPPNKPASARVSDADLVQAVRESVRHTGRLVHKFIGQGAGIGPDAVRSRLRSPAFRAALAASDPTLLAHLGAAAERAARNGQEARGRAAEQNAEDS